MEKLKQTLNKWQLKKIAMSAFLQDNSDDIKYYRKEQYNEDILAIFDEFIKDLKILNNVSCREPIK